MPDQSRARIPDFLAAAFSTAVAAGHGSDRIFERSAEQEALHARALEYGAAEGWDPAITALYATTMVRRAKDLARQERAWAESSAEHREQLRALLAQALDQGQVCVAARFAPATGVLSSGRFATQFETGTSGALLDPELRRMGEWAAFDAPPRLEPRLRPVYGFVSTPGRYAQRSVGQYGPVRFVLTEAAARRSTMTIGDSLNWHATPVAMRTRPTERQASDACARRADADWGLTLVASGLEAFQDHRYLEAQVHGGVTVDDIEFAAIACAPHEVPDDRRLPFEAAALSAGIAIRWEAGGERAARTGMLSG